MFDYDNFTFPNFIDYVLEKLKLGDLSDEMKMKYQLEIAEVLGDRIITAIFNAMTKENFELYDEIRKNDPELEGLEAVLVMIDQIPSLHEVMVANINDLAKELTRDAERTEEALKKRDEKLKK